MTTENYVYKKEVDWSLLQEGLTLPFDNQVVFGQIMGRFLNRGESKDSTLPVCALTLSRQLFKGYSENLAQLLYLYVGYISLLSFYSCYDILVHITALDLKLPGEIPLGEAVLFS